MCGISGIARSDPNGAVDPGLLRRMTDIVSHRGPNGEGSHSSPGIGLGVRRLAIIDLRTGDQPLYNEDKTLALVCNGEIYNHPELRQELLGGGHRFRTRSDAEVIVHLYEERGVGCLHRLRGMFAFALWDARKRRLFLARDRLGIKPLHFAAGENGDLLFASEQKSILITGQVDARVDPQAMRFLFTLGFIPSPATMFRSIRRLLPGNYLLYRSGEFRVHQYWDFPPQQDAEERRVSPGEWSEVFLAKLEESVKLHLRSDVPVGAWLSGGIDSSAIAALMSDQALSPVRTFSLAFPEHSAQDEVTKSKILSDFPRFNILNERVVCGADHFRLLPETIWCQEDPDGSGVHIAQMLLSEAASRRLKVVLTGEGADELLGGYHWYRFNKMLGPFSRLPLPIRRCLLGPFIPRWKPWASQAFLAPRAMTLARYANLIGPTYPAIIDRLFTNDLKRLMKPEPDLGPLLPRLQTPARWSSFAKLQYIEAKTRLEAFVLHGLDRASMGHSLEVRVPFLDHELVELCARIPASLKLRRFREKYILRAAMRRRLPAEIVKRRKKGLAAPRATWLRAGLPEFAREMFSTRRIGETGFFVPETVRGLLADHSAGRRDYSRLLIAILSVEIWHEMFGKGIRSPARLGTGIQGRGTAPVT
ncbi:MAG: asparagine synthase (glutamine-hydrolyzing) [Candidatus Eisenbacteria bacterium]